MVTLTLDKEIRAYAHQYKPTWNIAAIAYTLLSYWCGLLLLTVENSWLNWLNIVGVLCLTHSLSFSAYLSHELMHGNIFKARRWNEALGNLMLWLNGGCYFGFQALTRQHIEHHVDRVDVFTFNPIQALKEQPVLLQKLILTLEWCYFPAMGLWARWQSALAPFWHSDRKISKSRVTILLLIRCIFCAGLFLFSPRAVVLYAISYISMINVLRWAEVFQHTYDAFPPGVILPKRSIEDEQINTFTTLISRQYPILNLLCLNFGYHNAHHALMTCPWHSLHQLDQKISEMADVQYVPLRTQLINYHRFRIARFADGLGKVVRADAKTSYQEFYGAHDVSFLMLY